MNFFLESKDQNYCYIPIPKNASSYGYHVFKNILDFEEIKLHDKSYPDGKVWCGDKNKHYIVFLRDPLDRWFSGVAQFLFETKKELYDRDANLINSLSDNFILDPLHLKILFSHLSFDTHTMDQASFIRHNFPELLSFKTTFFYIDDPENYISNLEFRTNLEYFIYKNLGKKIYADPINTAKEEKFKYNIKNQLKLCYANNSKYKNILDNYLQGDYNLIKNFRFYKGISVKLT